MQRYAPEIQRRLRTRLRPTNDSWRVDETYIRHDAKLDTSSNLANIRQIEEQSRI